MSLKASPPLPEPTFKGDLVESLVETVARHTPAKPTLTLKPTPRDYFRLTVIPEGAEMPCTSADCHNPARLLVDSRDSTALAFCRACAHVEFAMWMVAV